MRLVRLGEAWVVEQPGGRRLGDRGAGARKLVHGNRIIPATGFRLIAAALHVAVGARFGIRGDLVTTVAFLPSPSWQK